MAKRNPTLQYFTSPGNRDGAATVAGPDPDEIPPNRIPAYRLGFRPHEGPSSWELLADVFRESALPNASFFLDSSFLGRREVPQPVWDALLSRQIVITPLVWSELQDWIANPFANEWFRDILVSARSGGSNAIVFLDPDEWTADIGKATRYYIDLLVTRKLMARIATQEYNEQNGRSPTKEELTRLLQRKVRDRGLTLARKGQEDFRKANFAADEQLVVCAGVHSLVTGRESTILTSDPDLLEQFYKLWFLVDTHYRSMLIAENYASTPDNVLSQALPHDGIGQQAFADDEIEALKLPRNFVEWVLPDAYDAVNAHCIRLTWDQDRMKTSSLHFCAETQMARVLRLKGECQGRNTNQLGERNLHLMTSPPFPRGLGGDAIVGTDRLLSIGRSSLPWVDLNYAVMEIERFRFVSPTDETTEAQRYVGLNLASFRATERLLFTRPPEWMEIPAADMQVAIEYFDPAAFVFTDLSFLDSPHAERYASSLLKRGLCTTTHIRDSITTTTEISRAFEKGAKSVSTIAAGGAGAEAWGYSHYLGILAFRKLFWQVIQNRVRRDHGRDSPDNEWPTIVEHYAGTRGRRLAEYGWEMHDAPTLFYGEELLVHGMISGCFHGADIVLLTCDPLFFDQFVKLGKLVSGHYLAAEFGRAFASTPSRFSTRRLDTEEDHGLGGFAGDHVLCCDLPANWESDVLPKSPFKLNWHCWLFAGSEGETCRFMPFSFCTERPMQRMLRMKSSTGGLNTNCLEGRNVRVVGPGFGQPASALIFEEEMVPLGSKDFPFDARLNLQVSSMPWADLVAAANNNENAGSAWLTE